MTSKPQFLMTTSETTKVKPKNDHPKRNKQQKNKMKGNQRKSFLTRTDSQNDIPPGLRFTKDDQPKNLIIFDDIKDIAINLISISIFPVWLLTFETTLRYFCPDLATYQQLNPMRSRYGGNKKNALYQKYQDVLNDIAKVTGRRLFFPTNIKSLASRLRNHFNRFGGYKDSFLKATFSASEHELGYILKVDDYDATLRNLPPTFKVRYLRDFHTLPQIIDALSNGTTLLYKPNDGDDQLNELQLESEFDIYTTGKEDPKYTRLLTKSLQYNVPYTIPHSFNLQEMKYDFESDFFSNSHLSWFEAYCSTRRTSPIFNNVTLSDSDSKTYPWEVIFRLRTSNDRQIFTGPISKILVTKEFNFKLQAMQRKNRKTRLIVTFKGKDVFLCGEKIGTSESEDRFAPYVKTLLEMSYAVPYDRLNINEVCVVEFVKPTTFSKFYETAITKIIKSTKPNEYSKITIFANKAEGKSSLIGAIKKYFTGVFIEDSDDYFSFLSYAFLKWGITFSGYNDIFEGLVQKGITEEEFQNLVVEYYEMDVDERSTYKSLANTFAEHLLETHCHFFNGGSKLQSGDWKVYQLMDAFYSVEKSIFNDLKEFYQKFNGANPIISQRNFELGIKRYCNKYEMSSHFAFLHTTIDGTKRSPSTFDFKLLVGHNADHAIYYRARNENYSMLQTLGDVSLRNFYERCDQHIGKEVNTSQLLLTLGLVLSLSSGWEVQIDNLSG